MFMKRNNLLLLACLLATSLFMISPVKSHEKENGSALEGDTREEIQNPRLIQGLLGVMEFSSDSYIAQDDNGEQYSGDMPTMPFLGGMWQNSYLHGDLVSLGGEAGFLFGFVNDSTTLTSRSNNGAIRISIKNQFFVIDTMFGLNLDVHPTNKFRIYGGAGPLLLYGHLETDNRDDDEAAVQFVEDRNSDFDIGFYGRIGTDILLGETMRFGVQVRYVDAELDFGTSQGRFDMEGIQYMVTFTEAF